MYNSTDFFNIWMSKAQVYEMDFIQGRLVCVYFHLHVSKYVNLCVFVYM